MKEYIIKIKDLQIPYIIKNYKKSKTIKLYFKNNMLTITKSPYVSIKEAEKLIIQNGNMVYNEYKRILEKEKNKKSSWSNGQTILYKGKEYIIKTNYNNDNVVRIKIDFDQQIFNIYLSNKCVEQEEEYVKEVVLKLMKRNTENILKDRLPYWSKKTNIKYNSVKVRDAISKYGSCVYQTKALHFTSRLIMLKEEAIDAVIVHELCHIIHPNHSKEFYNLVISFIPNYKELDKYLKQCSKYIRI